MQVFSPPWHETRIALHTNSLSEELNSFVCPEHTADPFLCVAMSSLTLREEKLWQQWCQFLTSVRWKCCPCPDHNFCCTPTWLFMWVDLGNRMLWAVVLVSCPVSQKAVWLDIWANMTAQSILVHRSTHMKSHVEADMRSAHCVNVFIQTPGVKQPCSTEFYNTIILQRCHITLHPILLIFF